MAMTIGQGLILGAQNYVNAQETERRRKWEDEERARQRRAWTARDETMSQIKNVGTERAMGDVPAENWQDPPVATRQAALDPQQRYEQQQRILSSSEDPALMTQGIGMYPQVEQGKELAYQRGMRDKRNAAAKQYSDMLSAINEGRTGVHSGELHPAVAMKALGSFQSANLAVAGVTGKEQWSFIDDKGKAQFRPITKADVLKLLDEAEVNVRRMYDDAVMGLSAEDAEKVIGRKLEERKVGATETSAEASKTTAGAAAKRATLEESLLEDQRKLLGAHANYYDAAAGHQRAGKGAINDARTAEAEKKREIIAATKDYEIVRGILMQNATPDGKPLTEEARARYMQNARDIEARILLLQGKDPTPGAEIKANADGSFTVGNQVYVPDPKRPGNFLPATGFGPDPTVAALKAAAAGGKDPFAPAPTTGKGKLPPTPGDRSNAEAQALAAMDRLSDTELQATIRRGGPTAPYAQQVLDYRRANPRPQAIPTPPYVGAVRPSGLPAAR